MDERWNLFPIWFPTKSLPVLILLYCFEDSESPRHFIPADYLESTEEFIRRRHDDKEVIATFELSKLLCRQKYLGRWHDLAVRIKHRDFHRWLLIWHRLDHSFFSPLLPKVGLIFFKTLTSKGHVQPVLQPRRFKKRLSTSAFSTSKGEHPHPHFIILQGSSPSIDTKHSSYCEKDAIGARGNIKRIMTTINTLYKNILKKLPLTQRYPQECQDQPLSCSCWNTCTAVIWLVGPGKGHILLGFRKRWFCISAKWAESQAAVVMKCYYKMCFLDFTFPEERVLSIKQALRTVFLQWKDGRIVSRLVAAGEGGHVYTTLSPSL